MRTIIGDQPANDDNVADLKKLKNSWDRASYYSDASLMNKPNRDYLEEEYVKVLYKETADRILSKLSKSEREGVATAMVKQIIDERKPVYQENVLDDY
jgi:hypothetical protein